MLRFLTTVVFGLWATASIAQTVQQSGTVTGGHAAIWSTTGVIRDGGTAASGNLTSLGVTAQGPGICQNTGPTTGPYQRMCFSVSTAGPAQITLQNFGGATPQNLQFVINGTVYSFPFGAFPGFANPVIPGVNLVGSNGTSSFSMRSDAVLVLDQSIAPTWTSAHIFAPTSATNPAITINTVPNSFAQGFSINQTVAGSGGAFYLNSIIISSDVGAIGAGFGDGFVVQHNLGGVGFSGGREALKGYALLTTATSGSSNNNVVGVVGIGEAFASMGGTSRTVLANTAGAFFGGNFFGRLDAGVTNFTNVSGAEFNVTVAAGASVFAKTLAQFAGTGGDAVSGSVIDTMTWFYGQITGLPKFSQAILIEDLNGLGDFPIKSTGTIFKAGSTFATYTVANGIDMHLVAFTGNAWNTPGAALSGAGQWTLTGSANYAIDTVGSTYLQAIRLANGLNIVARNAANSGDAGLLGYDNSNNLELGASIAGSIVTGSFVIPRVDNTWSVGSSTNRYTAFNGISADLGEIGVGTGSIVFRGTTGGTLTQTVQATAGTPTVTWGTSSGTPVVTATAPCVITAATGNLVCTFASSTLTSAHIFVGNGSNVATDVAMSGDISITNAGVTTLVSGSASNLNSGTLLAARMPALTGDITTSVGTVATTLATVNANVGTFGNATQVAQITANAKGLTTAVANVTITPAIGSITGLGTGVATALGINVGSAGAPIVSNGALGTPSSGTVTNLTGTANININGTVGATTPAAGVFTTAAVGTASQDVAAIFTVAGVGSTSGASGGWQMVPRTGSTHTWLWYSDAGKARLFDEAAGASGFTMDDTTFLATFSGQLSITSMTQTAAAQSGTVCYNTSGGAITYDATLGCLASFGAAKNIRRELSDQECIEIVTKLKVIEFTRKLGYGGESDAAVQIGFEAEQVDEIDSRLTARRQDGSLGGVRYAQNSAIYACAFRAVVADNDNLRQEVEQLKRVSR